MATLTETAYYARKIIRWGSIGIVSFIILRLIFIAVIAAIRQAYPPPPLIVNNAFGKLPKIKFPLKSVSDTGQLTYTLHTVTADIPKASDAARVFFMPKNKTSLLALSGAQNYVKEYGFTASPTLVKTDIYRWTDITNPLRTIEMDVVNNHFVLEYAYAQDLNLFQEKQIISPLKTIALITDFIDILKIKINDIDFSKPRITYLKLLGNILEPTTSQSQADAVRYDLFRNTYFGFPILTDKPDEGIISFIFSGSTQSDKKILFAKFQYWPIDINSVANYKLKTGEQAWAELTAGQGYVVFNKLDKTQIPITHIYLAYYDSLESQLFLQPVFVFASDDKFMAFIPAVAPPWTE